MSRHCHICREAYSLDSPACPACGAPADGVREPIMPEPQASTPQPAAMEQHANGSGADIDLGSPVFQSPTPTSGPLSGAAFVSWADRLNRMVKPLGSDGHRLTVPVEGEAAEAAASIDLGSPVTDAANSPSGPPSGASFVAWSSLAERRKTHAEAAAPTVSEAARAEPVRSVTTSVPAPAAPAAAPTDALRWVLLGVVIGLVASTGLWVLGIEPPQELRRLLNRSSPAQPAEAP